MPRPVSWLPRLYEIRLAVAHSVRSHYDRKDIERLFQLQSRAAQKLLEMFPTIQVGTTRLIDREVLFNFLDAVHNADDPADLLQHLRVNRPRLSRRRPRSLVQRDIKSVGLASLPSNVQLRPGQMLVHFGTIEELAQAMYALARVLEDDGDAFVAAFEPAHELVSQAVEPNDTQTMFIELATLERNGLF